MREIQLCGIGNALVDVVVHVPDRVLRLLNLENEKGTMRLISPQEQEEILRQVSECPQVTAAGGSVANSTFLFASLGGQAAFFCSTGADDYGEIYRKEFEKASVRFLSPISNTGSTGACVSVISEDAERTMRTSLGLSAEFGPKHINDEIFNKTEWLFCEGFVMLNSEVGRKACFDAMVKARKAGTKRAITCSEPIVISILGDEFKNAVFSSDLVFANEEESQALSSTSSLEEARRFLFEKLPNVVITAGEKGAFYKCGDIQGHAPSVPSKLVDQTGAGDAFAGSFLWGITHGYSPAESAKIGNFYAHKVISDNGARLKGDARKMLAEALSY